MKKFSYIFLLLCALICANSANAQYATHLTSKVGSITKVLLRGIAQKNASLVPTLESSINTRLIKPVVIAAALANENLFTAFGEDVIHSGADLTGLNDFKHMLFVGDDLVIEDGRKTFMGEIKTMSSLFEETLTGVSQQGSIETLIAAYASLLYPPLETVLWIQDYTHENIAQKLEVFASMSIMLERATNPQSYSGNVRKALVDSFGMETDNKFSLEEASVAEIMLVARAWFSRAIEEDAPMNGTAATYRDFMNSTMRDYISVIFHLFNGLQNGQRKHLEKKFSIVVKNVAKVARNYGCLTQEAADAIIDQPIAWLKSNSKGLKVPTSSWFVSKRKF